MLRQATAAASGLAMNVGPCMSTPPSADTPSGHALGRQRRGHAEIAAGERLAEAEDVRRHAGVLAGEQPPGAPEARGDLVGDQQHVVPTAELRDGAQVIRRVEPHAARALHDRLEDHGGDLVACASISSLEAVDVAGASGSPKRLRGRSANRCRGSTAVKRSCMPLTGSQTAIAPKVSPW